MGKSNDTVGIEKGDNRTTTTTTTASTKPSTTSPTNILLWLLCLASLAFSAYTSLGQTYFEDRIRHIRLLNDRVSILEARIQALPEQWLDRVTVADATLKEPEDVESIATVIRRLSAQVSGMSRIRRDVSNLKSRRQTASQQTGECMCPPGN